VVPSDVVLSDAETVEWRNGSLGCPEPGQMYTQALVPGFRVVANSTQGTLVYHTDSNNRVVSCERQTESRPKGPDVPPRPVEPRTGPAAPTPDR